MFLNILIISVLLITVAFVGLGISILLKKDGKFLDEHSDYNDGKIKTEGKCYKNVGLSKGEADKSICSNCRNTL